MKCVTVSCPKCGRSFEANAEIEKVTCNFCGAVIFAKDSESKNESGRDSGFSEYFGMAVEAVTSKITVVPFVEDLITKEKYPAAFGDYYSDAKKSFDLFDSAVFLLHDSKKDAVESYAKALAQKFKSNNGVNDFGELKGMALEKAAVTYVAFLIPAVLKHSAEYSDNLADALVRIWNGENKKRKIAKSSYENIVSGFKTKLCFITTAVCDSFGLDDDCTILKSFRNFRDAYLLNLPDGRLLINEYYLVAPMIVRAIDSSSDKQSVYLGIFQNHLSKCLSLIERQDFAGCKDAYSKMVTELQNDWL